jgi:hypothetical protein
VTMMNNTDNASLTNLIQNSPKPKIQLIRKVMSDCKAKVKIHKAKYRKLKKIDDLVDATNALLTGASISCTILGIGAPPLLIVSASLSGISFISSRVQDKYNLKQRYEQHKMSIHQYSNITREITSILTKNNLSSEEYHNYLTELYDKISLIEDGSIII